MFVLVFLAVVCEDEILELDFDLHPVLVGQRGPDVVDLGHRRLVRLQDDLRLVVVHMQRSQDQDQTGECLKQTVIVVSIYMMCSSFVVITSFTNNHYK